MSANINLWKWTGRGGSAEDKTTDWNCYSYKNTGLLELADMCNVNNIIMCTRSPTSCWYCAQSLSRYLLHLIQCYDEDLLQSAAHFSSRLLDHFYWKPFTYVCKTLNISESLKSLYDVKITCLVAYKTEKHFINWKCSLRCTPTDILHVPLLTPVPDTVSLQRVTQSSPSSYPVWWSTIIFKSQETHCSSLSVKLVQIAPYSNR